MANSGASMVVASAMSPPSTNASAPVPSSSRWNASISGGSRKSRWRSVAQARPMSRATDASRKMRQAALWNRASAAATLRAMNDLTAASARDAAARARAFADALDALARLLEHTPQPSAQRTPIAPVAHVDPQRLWTALDAAKYLK